MGNTFFYNAAPMFIPLGADDKSSRKIKPTKIPVPQHCPKFFFFAQKGTTESVLMDGPRAVLMYGADTFDPNKKFYNHATRYMSMILGTGNAVVCKRVVPSDALGKSSCNLYIDILETEVPNYLRYSTGDLVPNDNNIGYKVDPVKPTISGYKVKFIAEHNPENVDPELGLLTPKAGTMTDGNKRSTMYPIMEFVAKEVGEYYNNIGFIISPLTKDRADASIITKTKSFPYEFGFVSRPDANTTYTMSRNLYGETVNLVSLKPKAKNPSTDARIDIETVIKNLWFNETDVNKPLIYNPFKGIYIYRKYIELVSRKFLEKEAPMLSTTLKTWEDGEVASTMSWFDFTTNDINKLKEEELYLFNIFSLRSFSNVRYFSVQLDDSAANLSERQKEVTISSNTPIFLNGGTDGTLSNEEFEKAVIREMEKYLDPNSEVQDLAINPESIFYDSGFTLDTKKHLFNFISVRKDTFLSLSTHDSSLGNKYLNLSDTRAIAVALKTRGQLAPESTYYGTEVARCIIVGSTMELSDNSTEDRVSTLYEIAYNTAVMMGASDGVWKSSKMFDNAPGNIIKLGYNIQPKFIPNGIKPTLWADGLIWAQPYDMHQFQHPALQTIYSDDTSALNNYFVAMALTTCTKIAHRVWTNFTGSAHYTADEFKEAVFNYALQEVDVFDGVIKVIPEVIMTDEDITRGYSWQLKFKLYGGIMKTVQVYTTEVYRLDDLATNKG